MITCMVRCACFDVQVEVDFVATELHRVVGSHNSTSASPVTLRVQLLLHVVFYEPTSLDELCSLIGEMASK